MIASEYSRVEIVKTLLQAGALFDIKNKAWACVMPVHVDPAQWYCLLAAQGLRTHAPTPPHYQCALVYSVWMLICHS